MNVENVTKVEELAGAASALIDVFGMTEDEMRVASYDAVRYRWLVQYMVSNRQDLDDAIVAAKTKDEYDAILNADMLSTNACETRGVHDVV